MKSRQFILLSLLISMVLFAWVTWPLGKWFSEAMPASHRPAVGGPRAMIAGDHLQFLFQLWMLADAIEGKTPLFYHIYEFNQGNDEARRIVGSYYFPFGLFYAAGQAIGGRAVGWNLMLFIGAWLTYLMTWILTRRYSRSLLTSAVAALPGLLLPYMWTSSLGGSPTGLGMMWVPIVFLGIDKAVRDQRVWGGVLAGVALFVSPWSDLHVFFFAFLAAPVWMLFALLKAMEEGSWSFRARRWRELVIPLAPMAALMGASSIQMALAKRSIADTAQAGGRSVGESLLFAPRWEGWLALDPASAYNMIYLGWVVVAVLFAGLLVLIFDAWRKRGVAVKQLALFGFLLVAALGIAVLALGPNVPGDSTLLVWRAVRKLIPPYKMIRQPAKVFCILAPFLAVALTIGLDRLRALFTRRTAAVVFTLIVAMAMSWDYERRVNPTLCLLDYDQGAYRAISEDAAECGRENRAVSLPIWPGDSHWNSLTEYDATLYRTKMLNGYDPSVSLQYRRDIFERLAPLNIGHITDDRLDQLLAMKIGYITIQEDAFPDKVSPFPVTQTIATLLHHPRIEFLTRDAEMWAFKILPAGEKRKMPPAYPGYGETWLSVRSWWAPDFAAEGIPLVKDETGRVTGVQLTGNAQIVLPPCFLSYFSGLRYVVAARGAGQLKASFRADSNSAPLQATAPVTRDWSWMELPVPPLTNACDLELTITASSRFVEVGRIVLLGGPWTWLEPGKTLSLRADRFFRAGYSDPFNGSVHLRKERDPADVVFYGPNIPLVKGHYRMGVIFSSTASADTELGEASLEAVGGGSLGQQAIKAGQPLTLEFQSADCRPVWLNIRFARRADLTIQSVTFTRID